MVDIYGIIEEYNANKKYKKLFLMMWVLNCLVIKEIIQ